MYIYKENTERNGTSEALINDHTRQHKAIKAVPNKEDARGSAHLSMQHRPQPVQLISAYHLPGRTCSSLPPGSCSETPANHTQWESPRLPDSYSDCTCLVPSSHRSSAPSSPIPAPRSHQRAVFKRMSFLSPYHFRLHIWDLTTGPPTPSLPSDPSPFPHRPHSHRFSVFTSGTSLQGRQLPPCRLIHLPFLIAPTHTGSNVLLVTLPAFTCPPSTSIFL